MPLPRATAVNTALDIPLLTTWILNDRRVFVLFTHTFLRCYSFIICTRHSFHTCL